MSPMVSLSSVDMKISSKLIGINYHEWKRETKALLMLKGLWGSISGEDFQEILEDFPIPLEIPKKISREFKKKCEQAYGLICHYLDQTRLDEVSHTELPDVAWKVLEEKYEKQEAYSKVRLINDLLLTKMSESDDLEKYIHNKMTISKKLEASGCPIASEMMTVLLVQGLPDSLSLLKEIIKYDKDLSLEKVLDHLRNESTSRKCQVEESIPAFGLYSRKHGRDGMTKHGPSKMRDGKICRICESEGRGARYHKEKNCWFGNKKAAHLQDKTDSIQDSKQIHSLVTVASPKDATFHFGN
jgi:hypothetical protein